MSIESFESIVNAAMEKVCSNNEITAFDVAAILGMLAGAHDREIRDVSQQQYDRGYHAGQHSMDAEHRAVAMRLRHLPLDGGSHENLSQIARAVYHADFGWTQGACAALRDELVRLMGGVRDGTSEPMTTDEFIEYINQDTRRLKGDASKSGDGNDTCDSQCRGSCAAGDGDCFGEQEEIDDGRAANDSAADTDCGDGGGDLHMAGVSIPDITDELRKFAMTYKNVWCDDSGSIIYTTSDFPPTEDAMSMMNHINEIADNIDARFNWAMISRSSELGCYKLRINQLESERDELRTKLEELRGHSRTCPESGDGVSESAPPASITDELRRWANDGVWPCRWEEFKAIADRIDERARLGAIKADTYRFYANQMREERDNLLDLLRDAAADFKNASYSWDYGAIVSENITMEAERDELMKQRAEMTAELARRLKERDALQERLNRSRAEYCETCEEAETCDQLRAKMDECERTHVELPKDANGEVFRVDGGARVDDLVLTIRQMTLTKEGWKIRAYDENYEVEREASFFDACAPKPDLIEETIEKLTLGEITQTEAITRIKSFHGTARRE